MGLVPKMCWISWHWSCDRAGQERCWDVLEGAVGSHAWAGGGLVPSESPVVPWLCRKVHRPCLPRISVVATVPRALVGLWDTKALEVQCPLHISAKSPLTSHALQGQKESPGSAKALNTAKTLKMLFVPLPSDSFGDFLVGLRILFTFPEAKEQRDKGRRTGTLYMVCTRG